MLLGYGGNNSKFIVVISTGWQILKNLPCGDYLDTSVVGPDTTHLGTKLLGYGGDGNKFAVMEATSWHVVKNLTCEASVYTSFISPDMTHLGYVGDDSTSTATPAKSPTCVPLMKGSSQWWPPAGGC